MSKSRTPDAGEPGRTKTASGGYVSSVLPALRGWLIALMALVVVPWLVVAVLYFSRAATPEARPDNAAPPASKPVERGPWGRLSLTPIVVSPPLEYVSADWGRPLEPDRWHFPSTSAELVESFLLSVGLPADEVSRLRADAQYDPRIKGMVLTPRLELVRSLSPEVRARLYGQLARSQLNFDQANSFRFFGTSADAWLGASLVSPETRKLIDPLLYQDGGFLHFADPEVIRSQIANTQELQRLAKALLRQATVLVRLSIDDASEVDGLAEYWGRGGRRLDLRPLLESVIGAGSERSIDIVHLLPTFARLHLYRYPRLTTADLDKPVLANCLWTALNFFNVQPDDRFLDVRHALTTLRQSYYIVEYGLQLGDIVGFVDDEGDLYHVAVYLADDLVFTKNGTSPMAPWTIVTIDHLTRYYRRQDDDPRIIYHRRNDL